MSAAAKSKLSPKQQVFIERYLVGWNGAEAARLAGYSPKTAREQATRLLANVHMKAVIAERLRELTATADEVWARLTAMSRADMGDFVDSRGNPDWETMRANGVTRLVKKTKTKTTIISKSEGEDMEIHEVEVELYDAQAATVQLAKLLAMFPAIRVTEVPWQEEAKRFGLDPNAVVGSLERELFKAEVVVVDNDTSGDPD